MDAPSGTSEISFSSFLAGALLKNKKLTYIDLTNYMCLFENNFNVSIVDDNNMELYNIVHKADDGFYLKRDCSDMYNGSCTVGDYLNSLTNNTIREFFGCNDNVNTDIMIKPSGILKKIRTRIFNFF